MNKYLLIFLMLFSANAFPALTKWVDANGRVNYSDVPPPPNANKQKILKKTSGDTSASSSDDSAASSAPKTTAEREADLKRAQQEKKAAADKAAKQQADAENMKEQCASLKSNLIAMQQGLRIVQFDAEGNRSYMEDEQREQRMAKIQQEISANCK